MNALAPNQMVVSLGTNENRNKNLHSALDLLHENFGELLVAPIYDSTPVAVEPSTRHYLNTVVSFYSDQSVTELLSVLHEIEHQCGRDRTVSSVAMDIDFLFCGQVTGVVDGVVFPRKDILHSAYMLRPLADILPEVHHPIVHKNFSQLWREFSQEQILFPVDFVWQQKLISVSPPHVVM